MVMVEEDVEISPFSILVSTFVVVSTPSLETVVDTLDVWDAETETGATNALVMTIANDINNVMIYFIFPPIYRFRNSLISFILFSASLLPI